MGYSKRDFVMGALEELGMAEYVFDATADELQSLCRRLDAMMAQWSIQGLPLGYPAPGSPFGADINQQTGVPIWANEAVICSLAVKIAPSFGKVPSQETKIAASTGYANALGFKAPPTMQFPETMPIGSGNKYWNRQQVFYSPPIDTNPNTIPGIDPEFE